MARSKQPVKNRPKTGQKRDPQGRFLPGTAAGPGRPSNPYARRLAALKVAFAEAVSVEDVQAIAGKLTRLAKLGDVAAIKLFMAALIGPVALIDPDEIDRHELGVRQRQPTELDELMLIVQGNGSNSGRPELAAAEGAEDDEDTPEPEPTPEEPLTLIAWEQFAQERLEWDPQAAAPIDMVFLAYVRWSEKRDLPLLAEADMCTWLRENGAILTTLTYSQATQAEGVRVVD